MAKLLIIDDDDLVREFVASCTDALGHRCHTAETIKEGISRLGEGAFDLVLLDVNLPDGDGLELLPEIKKSSPAPEVVIITAEGDASGAEIALENDAWDYVLKPFSATELKLIVKRVLEFRSSKNRFMPPPGAHFDRSAVIGSSPKIMNCLNQAQQCTGSDANVLITGPTGTGKELFANTIHNSSNRNRKNLIVVDCAALPEQLVESVLFGNVKGAFTSADSARDGLVKKADGGTLFLDEIGELPLSIQKKFLRVLQERRFKPVGGTKEIRSDFRLISATNRDLEQMVGEDKFRSDLLFRIKTFHIELPALKHCREDIKPLVLHYIHRLCDHHKMETKGFSPEFLTALESYDWPGNVRELINSIERAILANTDSNMLYPNSLPQDIRLHNIKTSIHKNGSVGPDQTSANEIRNGHFLRLPEALLHPIKPLKQVKNHIAAETEKLYLKHLMKVAQNNMDDASQLACISKSRLYALLKAYHK